MRSSIVQSRLPIRCVCALEAEAFVGLTPPAGDDPVGHRDGGYNRQGDANEDDRTRDSEEDVPSRLTMITERL